MKLFSRLARKIPLRRSRKKRKKGNKVLPIFYKAGEEDEHPPFYRCTEENDCDMSACLKAQGKK